MTKTITVTLLYMTKTEMKHGTILNHRTRFKGDKRSTHLIRKLMNRLLIMKLDKTMVNMEVSTIESIMESHMASVIMVNQRANMKEIMMVSMKVNMVNN